MIKWLLEFINEIINLNDTNLRDMWLMERKGRRI